MQAWYRDLIRLRRSTPALNNGEPGNVRVTFDEAQKWLSMERGDILTHCNLGESDRAFAAPEGSTLLLVSRAGIEIRESAVILPPDSLAIVKFDNPSPYLL